MNNQIRIVQPHVGDRGKLTLSVEAENLPAGAYGALEPVLEEAQKWADHWLSVTTGDNGRKIKWWQVKVEESALPTRVKNPLLKKFGDVTLGEIIDEAEDEDGEFHSLLSVPRFGHESLEEFNTFVAAMESKYEMYVREGDGQ